MDDCARHRWLGMVDMLVSIVLTLLLPLPYLQTCWRCIPMHYLHYSALLVSNGQRALLAGAKVKRNVIVGLGLMRVLQSLLQAHALHKITPSLLSARQTHTHLQHSSLTLLVLSTCWMNICRQSRTMRYAHKRAHTCTLEDSGVFELNSLS